MDALCSAEVGNRGLIRLLSNKLFVAGAHFRRMVTNKGKCTFSLPANSVE